MATAHALRDRMLAAVLAGLSSAGACAAVACGKEDVARPGAPPAPPAQPATAASVDRSVAVSGAAGVLRRKASDVNRGRACISVAAAERFRRPDWGSDPTTGCPRSIDGRNRESPDWPTALRPGTDNDAYVDATSTQFARADAGGAVCCFGAPRDNEIIVGRALVSDAGELARVDVSIDGPALASEIGEGWLRDATFEHASVASFERAAIELERAGGPTELVEATRAAAHDEAHHARLAFALASRHLGARVAGGAIEACAPRAGSLAELAVRVLREGCIGESIAALAAERALAAAHDPEARSALRIIAADEARHAALAWRTVGWAVAAGGADVVVALRRTLEDTGFFADAAADAMDAVDTPTSPPTRGSQLANHGRLTRAEELRAAAMAWQDVIAPCCEALLG